MKWIMALNESNNNIYNNSEKYEKFALVAIHSALKNAPGLESYLIYNGAPNLFTDKAIKLGSQVIFHKLSFQGEIDAQKNRDDIWKQIAKGAMLRLDLPDILNVDQTILYTDTDVMFLSDPSKYLLETSSFAVGPEFDINNFHKINTGSMLINLKNCRKSFKDLRSWMINSLEWIPDYDQGAIQHYFDGKWDRLDPRMNWKPYWGMKDDAIIIHFHGPKPLDFQEANKSPLFEEGIYDLLYKSNPKGYDYYLSYWFDLHNEYFEKFKKIPDL
jgi:lipopolysaccharide biosynthesis glycosyltransferase